MRTYFSLALSALALITFHTSAYAAVCDQSFPSEKIRAGQTIYFSDDLTNGSPYSIQIDDGGSAVNFSSMYGGSGPVFRAVSANQIVGAGQSSRIIASSAYVVPTPSTGAQRRTNAIDIRYSVMYGEIRGSSLVGPYVHNECQPYEVTWCGDGVVDVVDGEQCDLGAQNGQTGSTCSATCQPVAVTPPPVCGSTVGNQTTSITSSAGGLCPSGSNVTGFQATGTNPINYSWTCSNANGSSPSCMADYIPPVTPPPVCGPLGDPTLPYSVQAANPLVTVAATRIWTDLCAVGTATDGRTSPDISGLWNNTVTATWTCTSGTAITCGAVGPTPPPVAPICPTTIPAVSSSPITFQSPGLCAAGTSVAGFQTTGSSPIVYAWNCVGPGGSSPSCTTSYTPPVVTPPPVCPTTLPAVSSSPITFQSPGLCAAGTSVAGFQTTGSSPIVYAWNCVGPGGSSPSCTTSYTPPVVGPQCGDGVRNGAELCDPTDTTRNGWGTATPGCNTSCQPVNIYIPPPACVSATATRTTAVNTLPASYSVACNISNPVSPVTIDCGNGQTVNAANGVCTYATAGSYTVQCVSDDFSPSRIQNCNTPVNPTGTPTPSTFDLSLKKYIDTVDAVGDAQTAPGIAKNTGNAFTYIIRVKNEGLASTSNTTTVTDTFPLGVNPNGNISAPGWSCNGAPVASTITCSRSDSLPFGQTYPNISVPVVVTATTGTVTNIGTVSNPDENPANNYGNNNSDPAVFSVTPPVSTGFDLSIRKYFNFSDDANFAPGISVNNGATYKYTLRVINNGPSATTGITTVRDILPAGVDYTGTVNGNGFWTCSVSGRVLNCTTISSIAHTGGFAPDIEVPFRVTATTGTIKNIASVDNPNETNRCNADGSLPTTDTASCTQDTTNSDPAFITVSLVNTPLCSSTISGALSAPIISSTPGLCSVGTVTGFTQTFGFDPSFNIENFQYTWNCTAGGQTSPECRASYTPPVETKNFDLRIKKYAKGEDVFASILPTEDYNYNIVVQNVGPETSTGVTTVIDILPSPIVLRDVPSGNGWTCLGVVGGDRFMCTTTATIEANQVFPVITVPVKANSVAFKAEGYVNRAFVHNPSEAPGKTCLANNAIPTGTESRCTVDLQNSDPATVNPPNPDGFDLRIKKFANGDDEATKVLTGGTVVYTFIVQNLGEKSSSGRITVTDSDFASGITIASMASPQGDWTCTKAGDNKSFSCTTDRILAKGEYSSVITLTANIAPTLLPGQYRNIACLENAGDPNNNALFDPDNGFYKVNNCDPVIVVIVPPNSFDLAIKKYVAEMVGGLPQRYGDHQTSNDGSDPERDILTVPQGGKLQYTFKVQNLGPVTATGLTTVEDTLPNGTTITSVTGTGWSCAISGNNSRSFICTRSTDLAMTESFPDIVVLADTVTTIPAGEYSNVATVRNPGDTNPTNNTDPANIEIMIGANCGTLTASPGISPQSPRTPITYSCVALGYTGTTANLEYSIKCGLGDTSSGSAFTGVSSRICDLPNATSTTQITTCAVREKSNPNVLFSGSEIGACRVSITTRDGVGTPTYYVPTCANGIRACSTQGHPSKGVCSTYNGGISCYETLAECNDGNTLTCSGPGGGCSGPSCSGGGGGFCGDGVLGSSAGEECDVVGAPWCGQRGDVDACKIRLLTNPGANPITGISISIPGFGNLGASTFLKKPFTQNSVVVGKNTRVFTIADKVTLDVDTRYAGALLLPADREMCLKSLGTSISSATVCNTLSRYNPAIILNGSQYVVINGGYAQERLSNGTYRNISLTGPIGDTVTLFKGSDSTTYPTNSSRLKDAFIGNTLGNDAMTLFNKNPITEPTAAIDMAVFQVRVSSVMVGGTSSTVNRTISQYFRPDSAIQAFLSRFSARTTTTTVTTSSIGATYTPISIGNTVVPVGGLTITSVANLSPYKLNGNSNIFSVRGTVTIENCPNNTFILDGVRTLIVEGTLIIKCNIQYADTTSSWAFITKNGDIKIYNGAGIPNVGAVTNLAGVYVAIPVTTGGNLTFDGAATTTAILRLDGSMYGNATPLFSSRLYVRGTNAYDILTTGVILSYSNRALVNPPPLLSNFLNNYSVSRVVR